MSPRGSSNEIKLRVNFIPLWYMHSLFSRVFLDNSDFKIKIPAIV